MKNTTRIGIVLIISIGFFIAEISVGFRTKSLALIADAFHYLNDIVAYSIAFAAAHLQDNGQHTISFTYAFHRAELVGAFFNGVFLMALALSILLQSLGRFINIEVVNSPLDVLIVACVGLALNIASATVVHDHGGHGHGHSHSGGPQPLPDFLELDKINHVVDGVHASHNHSTNPPAIPAHRNMGLIAVVIHLIGDAINNIGVIIAALIMWKLKSPIRFYADPAASLAISFIIFASALPITYKTGRILLEASPIYLDLEKIKQDITTIPGVESIHDLHVWSLSQSVILASLHVCVPLETSLLQWEKMEQCLQHCFSAYGIGHVTISPEIHRGGQSLSQSSGEGGGCQLPTWGDFGCSVSDLRKRKGGA
ncbi:CDF zinc transporter [Amanita rubescens]|nr:CDF zinc transporter [Amanita rubescens]